MTESTFVTLEVTPRIFDLIIDGALRTLPLLSRPGVFRGALVCFEEDFKYPDATQEFYQYALVEEIWDYSPHAPSFCQAPMQMIRFRLVNDLSAVIIS